jgi:catechol 2,3-dioxygenase-like lactoylglutathione lyase family enzyme
MASEPAASARGAGLEGARFVGFIPVRDAALARPFYEEILGLGLVEDSPFALVFDAYGTMVRVTPVGEFIPHPFTIAGFDVPDIDASARALTAAGVIFTRYEFMEQDELGIWTSPSGARVAWLLDPDGNTLSLTTFPDAS